MAGDTFGNAKVTTGQKTAANSAPVVLASDQTLPLPTGASTAAKQDTGNTSVASIDTKTPALVGGRVPVDGSGVTQPISAAALPLPSGASTSANQASELTLIGAVIETAPATDIASSGLNGRLQRIAQRLTSLIALLPGSLGQKTSAASLAVTVASDQSALQVMGNVASGQTDTGNPIKVGGVYNSTLPVVTTGQRVDLQLDASGRLLTSTTVTSQLPAASFINNPTINAGVTIYTAFTASQKLAIKQFYAGGTGVGKQSLYSYSPTTTTFVNSGDFEVAGDITNWPYFSNGGGGTGSVALSSAQAFTGTKSESMTFTNSDANRNNGVKQTFSSPLDISGWRYLTAEFFNTLSAGGTYTRTISIVATDNGGNTKKFDVSGLSTAAPFNASNWIKITGEINNPTSTTGTGFDNTQVVSIELRMVDSATRAGTVYWDSVKLEAQLTPIFPIYHIGNLTFSVNIDPVFVMNIGDQVVIVQTNNDTVRREYFAAANGVSI